jgi:hypothetical protein
LPNEIEALKKARTEKELENYDELIEEFNRGIKSEESD